MLATSLRNPTDTSVRGDFAHLHLHTQYSLLDGAIHMDKLAPAIKEHGMNTVAVTDHGNMYGAVHFYKSAKKHGIKPILGCEAYVASRGRTDRSARDSRHLVLLAKDNEGYKNLSYLVSMGFMEGFYYNPRIDKELLRKHSKGLYGLSACLGGVVNQCYLREGEAAAAEAAKEYRDIFAPGHFFLEIQDNGFGVQEKANQALLEIGRTYGIPMVATADSHYLRPEDSAAHEILMCIGQGRSLDAFRSKQEHSDLLYVKSPEQMYSSFAQICPEAVENAARIAASCNVELNLSSTFLPSYGVPDGMSAESYLEQITFSGLAQRIKEAHHPVDEKRYRERAAYELDVINGMGFAGYFLIVWDFISFSKRQGIPVGPGRGSGAGSLVAYALRITDLDPIPYDLIFERFLNPERVSMPDFDIDFCQDRRGEVIDYVAKRYGGHNVGQIVTYSALSTKSVIKDVGRVLELPFAEVNALTKLIPGLINGKKVTLDQALDIEPKLRDIQKEKPIYAQVIDIARSLEGLYRQTGMHAAGIVIGDKPLWEYVPVCRGKDGEIVTQFAKNEVEEAGLVKFDFLGLKTLTVIANAEAHVRRRSDASFMGPNSTFDISKVPLDDPLVYKLIATGDTDGVFQFESSGFKELLKRLRPDCFEDIVAAVALYRPGPLDAGMVDDYIARKHGKRTIHYPHPTCEPILKTTYGVIVYQEQVMRIAVDLCGFSMGKADTLRKAMSKKKTDLMDALRSEFVEGAFRKHQYAQKDADALFTQIEKFAGYAFNKSHSAAYAVISYHTAYLKTYFPVEFMAALLSTEMRTQDNVVRYIQSAKEHGMSILPPNVNISERDFSVVNESDGRQHILFGLGAVKGLGDAAIDSILQSRQEKPHASIFGFCETVDLKKVNRKVLEALVKCGAFDDFKRPRAQLLCSIDRALEIGQTMQKDRAIGQTSLFAAFMDNDAASPTSSVAETYPDISEWGPKEKLAAEKQALGFYITGHPLDDYADILPRLTSVNSAQLQSLASKTGQRNNTIALAGVVAALRERPLKNGNGRMAFITVEDLHGTCDVLVFSAVFAACEDVLRTDDPILVRGNVMFEGDDDAGEVKIRATAIERLADVRVASSERLELMVSPTIVTEDILVKLRGVLSTHHGKIPTQLTICAEDDFAAVIHLPNTLSVAPSDALLASLRHLLGNKSVALW